MPLSVGERLGPYEILAPIGAGGMGEVYRARDTKLNRDVAIKVLPAALANDADYMARFQREAQVLASLNHPGIAAIYGLEDHAIVMELVEGPTLADRIARGPLPLEEAVPIARQIAEALEAAHEKGIIHRDLKPANIKITPEGVVKVLDFGLAKVAGEAGSADTQSSPTLTIRATQAGLIMGTAAYMSPEQAAGRPVDKRADIWSFGVVLWEMLTGQRLFDGETISHTLADVLRAPIDFDKLPSRISPAIRNLVRRCLDRDVKERLRDIGEARIVLRHPLTSKDEETITRATPSRPLVWIVSAGLFALAAATLAFVHFREAPSGERTLRYTIAPPEGSTVHSFAISPDGHLLAIATASNGKRQLWLRPLDALQAQPMQGTDGAMYPFWSPDSRNIGFFALGKLKRIAASGGPAQSLCDASDGRLGSWNRDNVIVFSPSGAVAPLQRVSAGGGVPVNITDVKGNLRFPEFLPDGRHFLYLLTGGEKNGIYVGSLDGHEDRRIIADESRAVFSPSAGRGGAGELLFMRDRNLMALPFDARSLQVSGDVFPVAENASFGTNFNFALMTVSGDGVLVYASGAFDAHLAWLDRAGNPLGPVVVPSAGFGASISPDEKTIAYYSRRMNDVQDLWLHDLARGTDTRLTSFASVNGSPRWSPKGDRIVFRSIRGGQNGLYQRRVNGSEEDELLLKTSDDAIAEQWSSDGRFIVFSMTDGSNHKHLWLLPVGDSMKGGTKPISPFPPTQFTEVQGQISPDGHWIAYASDESGQREVYVRPFPYSEGKWRVSTAGGEQPRWRGDSKELFFISADVKMTAVSVKATAGPNPSFEAGTPVPLFPAPIELQPGSYLGFSYDVTANGKRFLIRTPASSPPLTVVTNWNSELKP